MSQNGKKLVTAYVYDAELRVQANRNGRNYWYEYIREINEQLGLHAEEIPMSYLEDAALLAGISVLFVGDLKASSISDAIRDNLDNWVCEGGVLIGFAAEGLDEVFGNTCDSVIPQAESDFDICGYFALESDELTTGIHSYLHPEQKLIIFSHIRGINPDESKELARLYDLDGNDTDRAAITKRDYQNGHAYYFAFNVPQTIWVLHQGIPITHDRDGDGYYRTGDLIAIGDNEREVLYADEILFLIQNMIAQKPQPMIYAIPPKGNQVPDAMFYWGGDDEAAAGTQLWASNWMKEKDLPYHINIMRNREGKFTVTQEEAEAIHANGHECSLHYNFIDDFDPLAFTEADVREQAEAFYKEYGFRPVCTVNHWCRWTGWAETAKWIYATGSRADNSFIHHRQPPLNPSNRLGFVFGTCFPFYFYDDYNGENRRIDFLEEPITAYEIGYSSSDVCDFDIIYKSVDMAVNYHLVMDMFYHPINVYDHPACRRAIEEVLRYIESKGIVAVHKGNDGLWEWWDKRSRSQITDIVIHEETADGQSVLSFTTHCEYDDGMIVKVPMGSAEPELPAMCDGQNADYSIREDFGRKWLYVIVPGGAHEVKITLSISCQT